MNHAAAISAVYRALAHYRLRQATSPTDHSAREIAQMSMLAEYLHETWTHSRFAPEANSWDSESKLVRNIPQASLPLRSNPAA